MSQESVQKYIEIKEVGVSPTKKTKIWLVSNKRSLETIGHIKWYGGFRKYVFYPTPPEFEGQWVLFDSDCMHLIAEFLVIVNRHHKKVI